MKFLIRWILSIIIFSVITGGGRGRATTVGPETGRTLSPYFLVTTDSGEVEQFSLKSTTAEVKIAGVIADVTITQVYQNRGKKPIECIYVFPASTRAAVYGMKMTIGERTIIAKIEERKKAREDYERAKEEGKSASLLEEQRPNVFQMNVANIMPGDEIVVELKYTELLVAESGVYEFVYPTVVGPRYSNQKEDTAAERDKWVKNPYLHEGEAPPYTFDIKVELSAGMSIQEMSSPSHKVNVNYDGPAFASITLDPGESAGGNRDYLLRYRLAGGKIESGLLLYEGEKENFFLLMVQPPRRVQPRQIPPREYIFIVDVSGSMYGFPLEISKKLLKDLISSLRATDTFNVLLFSGGSMVLSDRSLPATSENIQKAIALIDSQQGGGGTELLPALERALQLPGEENVSRTIVIATDGYVHVEKEAFDLIRKNLGRANMFTFGIGSGVNRFLIEGMARAGNGEPFVVESPDKAAAAAERFRRLIEAPVLTEVKVDWGKFSVYDVEPPSIPDVLAEKPVVIFGKYRGRPAGKIKLTGISGEGKYEAVINAASARPLAANAALRSLWARKRVEILADYNRLEAEDERVKEITRLGLEYSLLTEYTSFVAIDSLVRNQEGEAATIHQPLPLPEGVSDYAVSSPAKGGFRTERPSPLLLKPKDEIEAYLKEASLGEIILEKIETPSGIEEKAIRDLFEKEKAALEKCWQEGLSAEPSFSPAVKIKIEIDSAGRVTKVTVTSEPAGPKSFVNCLTRTVKAWTFPSPAKGKGGTITLTLNFKLTI